MKEQSENRCVMNESSEMDLQLPRSDNVLKESVKWQSKANSNSSTKCDIHNNALLFCSDCGIIVCGQCETRHTTHTAIKLCEASKMNKAKLAHEQTHVKIMIRYASHVVKDLNSYLDKLEACFAEITAEILERSENLTEGSDILAQTLISDIETEHDLESNRIRNKLSEFENFISSAKTVVVNCENLCSSSDDKYVTMMASVELASVSNLIKCLPVCPMEKCIYILTPVPQVSDDKTLSPEEMLGSFSKVLVPWRIEVKRIGSLRPDAVASSRFVTTMCADSDENVWVVWQWGPVLHLVDKEGNVKKSIDVGCKVDDICKHNNHLIVSSHEKKCIKILDSNHEIIKSIDVEKVPRGVYPVSKNELVACCVQNLHHKNGDVSSIVSLNLDSDNMKNIPCSEDLLQPWRIAVNVNGDICVSDRNKGAVLIFDKEGHLKAKYSGPESSTRHAFAPHALCCDRYGQIFIVDYTNHTVHVLDPLGRFRGFLIMDTELEKRAIFMGTSSPFSITMDSAGDVWVGNKFGYLTVLKYLK